MSFPYHRGAERVIKYLTGRYRLGGLLPSDGYITGVPKVVERNFDLVQSAAGAPGAVTVLHTYDIPMLTLKPNDLVGLSYGGFNTNNDNNKNLEVSVGGNNLEVTGLIDVDDLGWQFFVSFGIFNTTTIRWTMSLATGLMQADSVPNLAGGFGGRVVSRGGSSAVANIDSNNLTVEVRGQGTALGDITKTLAVVSITRF